MHTHNIYANIHIKHVCSYMSQWTRKRIHVYLHTCIHDTRTHGTHAHTFYNQWTRKPNMGMARCGLAAAACDDRVYALGGEFCACVCVYIMYI